MKVITINVCGIRSSQKKGIFDWLSRSKADHICMQETRALEEQIDNDYRGRTYKGAYGVTTGARVITDDNVLAEENLLNVKILNNKCLIYTEKK